MNYLAHIYLSFGDDEITLGNFIADSLRGNHYKHLPQKVQTGILLHRDIDTFTDSHPVPRISSKRLHRHYSHYSRVIVDIYYDHFLAKNWEMYSDIPLQYFVNHFYDLLEDQYEILPEGVKRMMPYMIGDDWLCNYASLDGISRVLSGMNRRTRNRSKMDFAIMDLEQHYGKFESEFTVFFRELFVYAKRRFHERVGE